MRRTPPAPRSVTASTKLVKGSATYQRQLKAEGLLSPPSAGKTLRVLDRALLTLGRDSRLRRDYLRGRWQRAPRCSRDDGNLRAQHLSAMHAVED